MRRVTSREDPDRRQRTLVLNFPVSRFTRTLLLTRDVAAMSERGIWQSARGIYADSMDDMEIASAQLILSAISRLSLEAYELLE